MSERSKAKRFPVLQGVLPVDRSRVGFEVLAGVTLAALAIPEVMGYATIAGMPVITGLYTILVPIVVFALLGSSRHLVVGADSATAAVLAAGLAGMAATGSSEYVALAGLLALMAGGLLLLARLVKLGFLADFLSRTVLVGFLTGVGIQVACGQVGGLLGIPEGKGITVGDVDFTNTIGKLISTLEDLGDISWTTVAVSAGVIVVILGAKFVTKAVPGALIAVLGAIIVSWHWDLADHGVSTLGPVPGGLPSFGLPDVSWSDMGSLVPTAASIFVLILAQSAATSRAYAARYDDAFDENVDLDGLAAANVAAGLSGTFVVNGSPTKTQMVDSAGGRSQLAQITTGAIVLIVLLFLTKPLQYMPNAVLAAVVFLIGIELVDIGGMRKILRERPGEFVVAALTALTVVLVGVEQGIVLAIVLSIIDHLRRSYRPATAVLVEGDGDTTARAADASTPTAAATASLGTWHSVPPTPDARSRPGLVVYRFASNLYYANANHFLEDVTAFVADPDAPPLSWFCIDAAAMPDIDMTGGDTIRQVARQLDEHHVKLVFVEVMPSVRRQLDRYGLTEELGANSFFEDADGLLAAYDRSSTTA